MAEKQKAGWKTSKEVRRLTVSKAELGRGLFGKVYLGKVWFGDKRKSVAVKIFHEPLSDEKVRQYAGVIAKLRTAGIPVLKTGFVKHAGNWVQVMELFRGAKRSKFEEPHEGLENEQCRENLFNVLAGIANSGIAPPTDCMSTIQTRQGRKIIVHDLDNLAAHGEHHKEVNRFLWWIEVITRKTSLSRQTVIEQLERRITHEKMLSALAEAKKWS